MSKKYTKNYIYLGNDIIFYLTKITERQNQCVSNIGHNKPVMHICNLSYLVQTSMFEEKNHLGSQLGKYVTLFL